MPPAHGFVDQSAAHIKVDGDDGHLIHEDGFGLLEKLKAGLGVLLDGGLLD